MPAAGSSTSAQPKSSVQPPAGPSVPASNLKFDFKGPRITTNESDARDCIPAFIGMEVIRGPGWLWGDQDIQGEKVRTARVGRITAVDANKKWVSAKFGEIERNFRAGHANTYDLRFFIRNPGMVSMVKESRS